MTDSAEADALELLAEWYDWWIETPGAPEKMPNALHVRTALLLTRPAPPHEYGTNASACAHGVSLGEPCDRCNPPERCPHGTVENETTKCRDCNRERALRGDQ